MESLPSGSLRVQVYAGIDPMTGKKIRLTETRPPVPGLRPSGEGTHTPSCPGRPAACAPDPGATVNELMDRYLQQADVERTTLVRYKSCVRVHVRPLLGDLDISRLARRSR